MYQHAYTLPRNKATTLLITNINTSVIYLLMAAINKSVIFFQRFVVGLYFSENEGDIIIMIVVEKIVNNWNEGEK